MKRLLTKLIVVFWLGVFSLFSGVANAHHYIGSIGLMPSYDESPPVTDGIALRYNMRVNEMVPTDPSIPGEHGHIMIIFQTRRLYNPENLLQTYLLDSNFYSYRVEYEDQGCLAWPPANAGPVHYESALWLAIPDYNFQQEGGMIGARPRSFSDEQMFPRVSTGIDNIPQLSKTEIISQMDVVGKNISIEYRRGETFTSPLTGWGERFDLVAADGSCTPALPANIVYRIWTATLDIDGASYVYDFAVPDKYARYLYPYEVFSITTEFLARSEGEQEHDVGNFQAYFWDIQIQSESTQAWTDITRFRNHHFPPGQGDRNIGWGPKISQYQGKNVLEISNDGTDTYFKINDVFDLNDTTCGASQMYLRGSHNAWGSTEMECQTDGRFSVLQYFDANSQIKFDVAGDWQENYGDNQPRDGYVEQNGQNIDIYQAGNYQIEFDYENKRYVIFPYVPPCGSEGMTIRGSFNDWRIDEMLCVDDVWQFTVDIDANSEYKFDVNGTWEENYGDDWPSDGAVTPNGANFYVEEQGRYTIQFDYMNKLHWRARE